VFPPARFGWRIQKGEKLLLDRLFYGDYGQVDYRGGVCRFSASVHVAG
jgi:hypothetical protein